MSEHQAGVVEAEAAQEPKVKAADCVSRAFSSFMESLETALVGRGNSIMVRVNDEALAKLDMLVAAGICKSRSESAAFLLQRGIEGSAALYDRIESVTAKISELKQDLLGAAG
jgi:hypothetical protein